MKWLRRSLLAVFILLLSLLAVVVSLIWQDSWRDYLLTQLLRDQGVEQLQTRGLRFSGNSLHLQYLQVYLKNPKQNLQLDLRQLVLRNPSRQQWLNSRSWAVGLQQLQAKLALLQPSQNENAEPILKPVDLLPENLLQKIPLQAVDIEQFRFAYQPYSPASRLTPIWRLSGDLHQDRQHISAAVQLDREAQRFKGELRLVPDQLHFSLLQGDQPWINVQSQLRRVQPINGKPARIAMDAKLAIKDLNHAEEWLALLPVTLPATHSWQGALQLKLAASLPEREIDQLLASNPVSWQQLNVQGQLDGDDLGLAIPDFGVESLVAKQLSAKWQLLWQATAGEPNLQLKLLSAETPEILATLDLTHPNIQPHAKSWLGNQQKSLQLKTAIKATGHWLQAQQLLQANVESGTLAWGKLSEALSSKIEFNDAALQLQQQQLVRAKAKVAVDINQPLIAQGLRQMRLRANANLAADKNQLSLTRLSVKQFKVHANARHRHFKTLAQTLISGGKSLALTANGFGSAGWQFAEQRLQLNLPRTQLSWGRRFSRLGSSVNLKQTRFTWGKQQILQIRTKAGVNATLPSYPPLKGNINVRANRIKKALVGKLSLQLPDLIELNSRFRYRDKSKRLWFVLRDEKSSFMASGLRPWLAHFAIPVEIEQGKLAVNLKGELDIEALVKQRQAGDLRGQIHFQDWSGKWETNSFENFSAPINFSFDGVNYQAEGELRSEQFDVGLPITNNRMQVAVMGNLWQKTYRLDVQGLQSHLLGGRAQIPQLTWDSREQQTAFDLQVYNWQLPKIIALLDRQDLKVSGVLDGRLPVAVQKSGITIKNGELQARKPGGLIQYQPDQQTKAYLKTQEQLNMAVNILDNYHYDDLDVELQQQADGQQWLALQLKGRNPNAYGGTQVNLNLNIEHNINPLLQTLNIPKKIQSYWEKQSVQ